MLSALGPPFAQIFSPLFGIQRQARLGESLIIVLFLGAIRRGTLPPHGGAAFPRGDARFLFRRLPCAAAALLFARHALLRTNDAFRASFRAAPSHDPLPAINAGSKLRIGMSMIRATHMKTPGPSIRRGRDRLIYSAPSGVGRLSRSALTASCGECAVTWAQNPIGPSDEFPKLKWYDLSSGMGYSSDPMSGSIPIRVSALTATCPHFQVPIAVRMRLSLIEWSCSLSSSSSPLGSSVLPSSWMS